MTHTSILKTVIALTCGGGFGYAWFVGGVVGKIKKQVVDSDVKKDRKNAKENITADSNMAEDKKRAVCNEAKENKKQVASDRAKKSKKVRKRISKDKNQAVRDQKIYTLGGEIFSSITHGIAAVVGVGILIICIWVAITHNLGWIAVVSVTVFGLTAFAGFTVSTIYHALGINAGKRVMRVLDHCSIYSIIPGTYTPFALIGIGGWVGWTIFGVNWALCALGATLTAVNREKFHRFAFICYLVMGWIAVIAIVPLAKALGFMSASFCLVFAGGVAYTIGAFVFKMKGKYVHGIWHLFTLAGIGTHFLSILFLMLG